MIFKRQPLREIKRQFFTPLKETMEMPDLIEVQKNSYKWFFDVGIKELFEEFSPVTDFTGRDLELNFSDY